MSSLMEEMGRFCFSESLGEQSPKRVNYFLPDCSLVTRLDRGLEDKKACLMSSRVVALMLPVIR